MRHLFVPALLWFSAIGCGLLAGVYFAFSTFVMTALSRIDPSSGAAAMNSMSVEIVRSSFIPLFMATTVTSAILAVAAFFRLGDPGSFFILAGGVVYVFGMFVVTMMFNVPLNDALAANPATVWQTYLRDWTFWNHVRTVASTAAFGLFVAAIASR